MKDSLSETQKELMRKLVQYKKQGDLSEPILIISTPHPKKAGRFILYLPLDHGENVILNDEFFDPKLHDFQVLAEEGFLGVQINTKGEPLYYIKQDGIRAVDNDFSEGLIMFDQILLEPEQKELLITMVEAARNLPCEKRMKFIVSQTFGGDSLIHPGVPNDKEAIYYGDIEILANESLLNLGFGSNGSPNFDVTPLGFRYYEYLKGKLGDSIEQMEQTMRTYIEAHPFRNKYSTAYDKWCLAEELLWASDSKQQLTTIGHLCREALQEYAEVLTNQFDLQEEHSDKAKDITRLKAVTDKKKSELGSTKHKFLNALFSYWASVSKLVQRQEHGAQKEGEELVWEDGRRVVFNTMVVMYELERAINL